MKIMVCLKQVPHQDARLDIDAAGTWIKEDGIKFEINSYDTYALEEALRIKEAQGGEVVILTMGPDRASESIRKALSMGPDAALASSDMRPIITRSGLSAFATAARSFATPRASEPSAAASFTCTARSAPMPSAVRSAWVTRSGPIDATTTSHSPASFARSASSRA